MNKSLKKPPSFLRYAPLIAGFAWVLFCGACLFSLVFLPRELINQLPTVETSLTLPPTTTPRPAYTTPANSSTPTRKIRQSKTPEPSTTTTENPSVTPPTLTASITQSNLAATYTATNTISPTQSITSTSIQIILQSITSPADPGDLASLSVKITPGAICQVSFVSPLGNLLILEGLSAIRADSTGLCAWSWTLPATIEAGEAKITVNASGVNQTFVMIINPGNQAYP